MALPTPPQIAKVTFGSAGASSVQMNAAASSFGGYRLPMNTASGLSSKPSRRFLSGRAESHGASPTNVPFGITRHLSNGIP